jgi:streptogramin lyase
MKNNFHVRWGILALLTVTMACGEASNNSPPERGVTIQEGDLLVTDSTLRALVRVNPFSGDRTLVSNQIGGVPRQIARDSDNTFLLTLSGVDFPVILRVDPASGQLLIVSSGGSRLDRNVPIIGDGPPFFGPVGLIREPSGQLIVSNQEISVLYRVDPVTGDRTILSGPSQGEGPAFLGPTKQLAREADGTLLVVVGASSPGGDGAIFRVNPVTGDRSILSSADVGEGPTLGEPEGIVLDDGGSLFVSDSAQATILQIDPSSGDRTIISGPFTGEGEVPNFPAGLTFDTLVRLLVTDRSIIYSIDLTTGDRTVIAAPQVGGGDLLVRTEDIFTFKN